MQIWFFFISDKKKKQIWICFFSSEKIQIGEEKNKFKGEKKQEKNLVFSNLFFFTWTDLIFRSIIISFGTFLDASDKECNYIGYLKNEPEACVAMTGCIGSEDVEFTILSTHVTKSPYFKWTKKGQVNILDNSFMVFRYFGLCNGKIFSWRKNKFVM